MNKKVLAAAIVGVLIIASLAGVLILTMGKTTGNDDNGNSDDNGDTGNNSASVGEASFAVTSFEVSKHNVLTDYETTVTVGLINNGTADGTYKLNITIDGEVVKSSYVPLGKGNSTTVSYNVSSSVVGNHTVAVGDNSTYLNCYDYYTTGAYMRYHSTEYEPSVGWLYYNWTTSIMTQNSTGYTANISYEGNIYPYEVYSKNKTESWSSNFENLTLVGMESVSTSFGVKMLTHYFYTFESGGYHFEVDTYMDDDAGVIFKSIIKSGSYVATDDLIDTNREWVKEL